MIGEQRLFTLNLFQDTCFTAIVERVPAQAPGGSAWVGRVEHVRDSAVTMVVHDAVMVVDVKVSHRVYRVRYLRDGVHLVVEVDPKSFGPD